MDFALFKKINDERMNYREMEDATVVSSYRNVGCGDGYRVYLKIENGKILDASYTTTGCGFGIVALAMATEIAKGKTVEEAEQLTEEDIEKAFAFPERRKNYPQSAIAALRLALKDYREGKGVDPDKRITGLKALAMLKENGHLRNCDLSSIILEKQNLNGVDFSGSNLHNAFLQNNSFEGASFEGANLRGAFLNGCNLKNANFRKADLRWAKLTNVNLENADFTDALYDIGTRVEAKNLYIFEKMKKVGKDLYLVKDKN